MPSSLRDIRRHMQSVQRIRKVTRAMEIVSMARNQRLQMLLRQSQAFADMSWRILNHLAQASTPVVRQLPIYAGYGTRDNLGLVVITSNSGMVGSYNHDILQHIDHHLDDLSRQSPTMKAHIITIGRTGRNHYAGSEHPANTILHADIPMPSSRQGIEAFTPVAKLLLDGFSSGDFDHLAIAYSQARAGSLFKPRIRHLLPLGDIAATESNESDETSAAPVEYIYEPDPEQLVRSLLPRIIRFQLFEAYLQAQVAENTARSMAMRSATKNGQELIQELEMTYNKARQETITAELVDLMAGSGQSTQQSGH